MSSQKISRRQFLRAGAAASASVVLAACQPKTVIVEKEVEKVVKETVEVEKIVTAPAAVEGKVTFWPEWGGKDADALKVQVDNWTEKTGLEVDYLPVRDHARMIAALSAGAPPDLLMTWDSNTLASWGFAGSLKNLEPFIERDKYDLTKLVPAGVRAGNIMGIRQIGLPLTNYLTSVFYWNKDTFENAGLNPETPPATWEDLWAAAEKITKFEGGQIMRWGYLVMRGQDAHPTVMAYGFGGSIYSADLRQVTPDSEANIEGLKWMRQFYAKYTAAEINRWGSAAGGVDVLSPSNPFYDVENGYAMMLTGEWMPSFWDRVPDIKLNLGAAYMPYPAAKPDVKGTMTCNTNPMAIPGQAKNPEAAWDLMKFLIEPENSAPMCVIVGNASPTFEGVAAQAAMTTNAMYKNLLEVVWAEAKIQPTSNPVPVAALYWDEYKAARLKVLEDGADPVQTMRELRDKIQPQLDDALAKLGI